MQQISSVTVWVFIFVVTMIGGVIWQSGGLPPIASVGEPSPNSPRSWPPRLGESYPDVRLTDLDGQPVRLSRYRGKVLVIESIGMPCKACQAFSGAHEFGGFGGVRPQPDLKSFEQCFDDFAGGASLSDDRLMFIQVLYYGPSARRPPTLAQARQWAEHFRLTSFTNRVVLVASGDLLSRETKQMIPGFQLVDHNLVLRCDAGNPPRQNLYRELLPMVPRLLRDVR